MLICGSVQANMHVSNQLIVDKDAFSYLPPFSMLWGHSLYTWSCSLGLDVVWPHTVGIIYITQYGSSVYIGIAVGGRAL